MGLNSKRNSQDSGSHTVYRSALLVVLVLSFALRGFLAFSGGQYYWPDEHRYDKSKVLVNALWAGDLPGSLRALYTVHPLFKVVCLVPVAIQSLTTSSSKIPAIFFSLFSVANLFLIWLIMRRLGQSERVALFAVSLLALCSTFLYYSRHLFPYDPALTFGLVSLWIALRTPPRTVDSILCAFFSACTFLTYHGYWVLAGFTLLVHALRPPLTLSNFVKRCLISAATFAVPLAAILSALLVAGNEDLLQLSVAFTRSVTQGSYSEGWSLPFAYFWHAEHSLLVLWVIALAYSLKELVMGRRNEALMLGLFGILFVYGTLVVFSVVLQKFVVYGRLARLLTPFFCMLLALLLERLWSQSPKTRALAVLVFAMAVIQAGVNFYQPLTQMFPAEFRQLASKAMTEFGEYEVLFADLRAPAPDAVPTKLREVSGRVVVQSRHPLQFLPYQYEAYSPAQRTALRSTDIRMRLILKAQERNLSDWSFPPP